MRIVFAARYRKIVIYKYSKKAGRQKITFQSSEYVVVYETGRILPDWNVKHIKDNHSCRPLLRRILPDWNVK